MLLFYKAIVYRLYSFCVLFVVSYIFTGDIDSSFTLAMWVEVLKFTQYILFERMWAALIVKK